MTYLLTAAQLYESRDKTFTRLIRFVRATGPASYATGGDLIAAADLGLQQLHQWHGNVFSNGTVAILAYWVEATKKVKFFDMAGAEIANATDLSTYTASVMVVGK